jgi:ABC-type Fe3+ transport system permease subunit
MTLTAKETRIIQKVSRPWWPRATLYCIITLVVCGVVSLGLAIRGCVRLYHMTDAGIQPATITIMSEAWISLMMGGIALMCSIFIWGIRRYGLLIRKLGDKNDA